MKQINGLVGEFKVIKASVPKQFQLAIVSENIIAITTNPEKLSKFYKVNEDEMKAVKAIINELGEIQSCQNSLKYN